MKLPKTLLAVFAVLSAVIAASLPAAAAVNASGLRYKYVSLDHATPPGSTFASFFSVTDTRSVYGTSYKCGQVACIPSIIVYRAGTTTVLHRGAIGYSANESGDVGGSVLTDPVDDIEHAAIFRGNTVELIPRLPNELTSHVVQLADSGIALVASVDATTDATSFYLFDNGTAKVLGLGSAQLDSIAMNDFGTVAATYVFQSPLTFQAFRYNPDTGSAQVLNPLPTEPDSLAQAINDQGDVLGYSFIPNGLERIGSWHDSTFKTSFVEGTPQIPTVSNSLLWNDFGLIVITLTTDNNSYIVPEPGVRLNVADLTKGLPVWTDMVSVNNRGDLLGDGGDSPFNAEHNFLLEAVPGT